MKRSFFALFVALLIHIIFFFLYFYIISITPEINKVPNAEKKIKISLKNLPKVKKSKYSEQKKLRSTPKVKAIPPMPKGKQLKKIIKKPVIKYKPKKVITPPKLNPKSVPVKKQLVQKKTKLFPPQEKYIPYKPAVLKTPKIKKIDDMSWLMEDRSDEITSKVISKESNSASAGKNIQELYGNEFGKLSHGQQKYILNNQEIMYRITQEILNRQYHVSNLGNLNVNKSNTIEFYLHPNGDMSDFKFLQKSSHFLLDDITKSTIEYAYSKYPRPTEKTLIRYNFLYNLAN